MKAGKPKGLPSSGVARDNASGVSRARFALELAAVDYGRALASPSDALAVEYLDKLAKAAARFHLAMCNQPDWNVDGGSIADPTPAGWAYPLAPETKAVAR